MYKADFQASCPLGEAEIDLSLWLLVAARTSVAMEMVLLWLKKSRTVLDVSFLFSQQAAIGTLLGKVEQKLPHSASGLVKVFYPQKLVGDAAWKGECLHTACSVR